MPIQGFGLDPENVGRGPQRVAGLTLAVRLFCRDQPGDSLPDSSGSLRHHARSFTRRRKPGVPPGPFACCLPLCPINSERRRASGVWSIRRGGRVADCTGLENQQRASVRGFESLPLRFAEIATRARVNAATACRETRYGMANGHSPGRRRQKAELGNRFGVVRSFERGLSRVCHETCATAEAKARPASEEGS
jgi:hypothetical protein